ncbi:MAG: helix-turn-helix domain-containing protein [Chitinophagaceae bacterium]|nr:helix-turn-helix domain-containing protein [Chitinophagaceae bacterium]
MNGGIIVLTEDQLRQVVAETVKLEIAASFGSTTENAKGEPDGGNKLLTRRETAQLLRVSLPTLHKWTVLGTVKSQRFGASVRYWSKDVEQALVEISNNKRA